MACTGCASADVVPRRTLSYRRKAAAGPCPGRTCIGDTPAPPQTVLRSSSRSDQARAGAATALSPRHTGVCDERRPETQWTTILECYLQSLVSRTWEGLGCSWGLLVAFLSFAHGW